MKDYSLDFNSQKNFILSYEYRGDTIILHLASEEKFPIPATLENEKKYYPL